MTSTADVKSLEQQLDRAVSDTVDLLVDSLSFSETLESEDRRRAINSVAERLLNTLVNNSDRLTEALKQVNGEKEKASS